MVSDSQLIKLVGRLGDWPFVRLGASIRSAPGEKNLEAFEPGQLIKLVSNGQSPMDLSVQE